LKSTVVLNQLGFFSERWRVIGGSAIFSDSPDLAAAGRKALHRSDAHTLLAISVGSLQQQREGYLSERAK
jgi:hypothetical protein